jgi:hypothetical protein
MFGSSKAAAPLASSSLAALLDAYAASRPFELRPPNRSEPDPADACWDQPHGQSTLANNITMMRVGLIFLQMHLIAETA